MRIDFSALYGSKELVVERDDFSQLEIRQSDKDSLHYFYDKKNRRLVTDFVLQEGARVATICTVTLIYKDGTYTPRLRFWKKDKAKPGNQPYLDIEIPDTSDTRMVKSVVDTSDAHRQFWILIKFLQECRELSLPAGQFKIVGNDSAEIAKMLQGSDKAQVVEALKSVLGNSLTQADLDVIANRKGQLEVFCRYLTDSDYFDERRKQLRKEEKDWGPEAVWQNFLKTTLGYSVMD
ncbi:hypothetical protein ABT352_15810 [Streptosporangium sp. NPDC000563]|uniref:hypothetical protein n=1 Tax=Streptosporangium sp. NPDC000563 TaxID=3154366 RepID=UPI00332C9746